MRERNIELCTAISEIPVKLKLEMGPAMGYH